MKKLLICALAVMMMFFSACKKETSTNPDVNNYGDVNEVEQVYAFINEQVNSISREEFDENYSPYYFDINSDGKLDVCYNTEEWYGKLLFFKATKDGYEVINSDANEMHKVNSIHIDEGFIVISGENINNAYSDKRTDLYYYDGQTIRFLGKFMTSLFNGAQTYFEGKGTIAIIDSYREFNYTYNEFAVDEYDNKTQHIRIDLSYKFNDSTGQYVIDDNGDNYNYLINPQPVSEMKLMDAKSQSTSQPQSNISGPDQYVLSKMENGDKVGNFTLKNLKTDDATIRFELEGKQDVEGYIGFNEMQGCYSFYTENHVFDKPIIMDLKKYNYTFECNGQEFSSIRNDKDIKKLLPPSTREYIQNGNSIKVSATIKDLAYGMHYQSEGYEEAELLNFVVLDDGGSSSTNGSVKNLTGFATETVNGTYINYPDYKCVIIPMNETENLNSLEYVKFGYGENQTHVFFSVLGSLHDVSVYYIENMGEEPVLIDEFDKISNARVTIGADFKFDNTFVRVTGKAYTSRTDYQAVKFTLDDARDPSDYQLIMIQ